MNIWEIVLLPSSFYKKLSISRYTLFIGMLLVGIKDIFFYMHNEHIGMFGKAFSGIISTQSLLIFAAVIVIGMLEVIFYAVPVNDFFKIFPKEENAIRKNDLLIACMKVYITANVIVIPVDLLSSMIDINKAIMENNELWQNLYIILGAISFLWYTGIIVKGINQVFSFKKEIKQLAVVFNILWIIALSWAINFIIEKISFLF